MGSLSTAVRTKARKTLQSRIFPSQLAHSYTPGFQLCITCQTELSPALKAAQISAPLAESRRKSALILPDECELGLPAATMGWARQSSAMPTY